MDLNILKTIMDDFRASGFGECRLSEAGITLELKRTVPEAVPAVAAGISVPCEQKPAQNAAADTADAAVVKAQMAGTFYTSAKPGEAPYVREGSHVSKGDTLGLLEAMKVISEITAPVSGTVESVMLEDAAFAEFDAPLFRIRPAE